MDPDNNIPTPEPTITLPLADFLLILWGYRDRVDRRDKAVPGRAVSDILAAIPQDVAQRYFHIQQEADGLPIIWEASEWLRSGHLDVQRKAESNSYNARTDKLTDWLIANIPFFATQERSFVRSLVHIVVRDETYDTLKPWGLSDELIQQIKESTY